MENQTPQVKRGPKPGVKRASYKNAVEWIALNDDPAGDQSLDTVSTMLTVVMVADLWGKAAALVAQDVLAYRANEQAKDAEPA